MELLSFLFVLAIVTVFATLSTTLGVDSREGSDDPRRPIYPVGIR